VARFWLPKLGIGLGAGRYAWEKRCPPGSVAVVMEALAAAPAVERSPWQGVQARISFAAGPSSCRGHRNSAGNKQSSNRRQELRYQAHLRAAFAARH